MPTPFPGMDPYLEHPSLWPDVHNRLIAAIADALVGAVAPRYYVGLERRAYLLKPDSLDIIFVGRPDVSIVAGQSEPAPAGGVVAVADAPAVYDVDLPMADEVGENFLEIHEVQTGKLVTLIELLSPVNKLSPDGRAQYLEKRADVLRTRTNLVEIDLLRAGSPLPAIGTDAPSDYRILVAPGWRRPHARLYAFGVRQPIPEIAIPLMQGEEQPVLALNEVLHQLYTRARFDLRLDYSRPPVPPLNDDDSAWAKSLTAVSPSH